MASPSHYGHRIGLFLRAQTFSAQNIWCKRRHVKFICKFVKNCRTLGVYKFWPRIMHDSKNTRLKNPRGFLFGVMLCHK